MRGVVAVVGRHSLGGLTHADFSHAHIIINRGEARASNGKILIQQEARAENAAIVIQGSGLFQVINSVVEEELLTKHQGEIEPRRGIVLVQFAGQSQLLLSTLKTVFGFESFSKITAQK